MATIVDPTNYRNNAIIVHTRKRRKIKNCQSFIISNWDLSQVEEAIKKYNPPYVRCGPSPIYNCHGLTFASRRTSIDNPQEIHKILEDDEYKEVLLADVLPGDIVLYFDNKGDVEHSGVVVSKPEPPLNVPFIVSKWGHGKEVIHSIYNCPYNGLKRYYRILK